MTDETLPTPDPAPVESTRKSSDPHEGYAVYDETLTRYVGGVHPTKSAAEKSAPARVKGHRYSTRKV